jgi:hypothetical protein
VIIGRKVINMNIRVFKLHVTVYVLAMVGHLEIVSPTLAQMPNRITNVGFTTVSPTIANTMLAVVFTVLIQLSI